MYFSLLNLLYHVLGLTYCRRVVCVCLYEYTTLLSVVIITECLWRLLYVNLAFPFPMAFWATSSYHHMKNADFLSLMKKCFCLYVVYDVCFCVCCVFVCMLCVCVYVLCRSGLSGFSIRTRGSQASGWADQSCLHTHKWQVRGYDGPQPTSSQFMFFSVNTGHAGPSSRLVSKLFCYFCFTLGLQSHYLYLMAFSCLWFLFLVSICVNWSCTHTHKHTHFHVHPSRQVSQQEE